MVIDKGNVIIRPARDSEARACRFLLPEMFTADQCPDLLVAVLEDPARPEAPRLAGAVALGTVHGPRDPGFLVLVHVVSVHRRQGIGRALIKAAVTRCQGRSSILRAMHPVLGGSPPAEFLKACGFDQYDRILHFEVDGLTFYDGMLRLRQRLEERGRIPARARIVRLRDTPATAIAELVSRNVSASYAHVLGRLDPASLDPYDLDNSVALYLGEVLGGALIYKWGGGLPSIEVRVLEPAFRGGWANPLLLEAATRNAKEAGAVRFRFFADDRISDTMSLARRVNAEQLKSELHFWRRVA